MISVAFGVPGVGKSTVFDELIKKHNLIKLYPGGIMKELAVSKGLVEHVDELRKLDPTQQQHLQEMMVMEMADVIAANPGRGFVIETHAVVNTPQGFFPGLRHMFFDKIKPDLYIVVQTNAEDIVKRRRSDDSRIREDDKDLEQVKLHLELTRSFAASYAVKTESNLSVVENREGKIEETIEELSDLISRFL